jgi:alpha-tubulin suppressor-like RCC1 family protein
MFRTRSLKRNKLKLKKVKSESNTNLFTVKISCGSYHTLLLSRDGDMVFGSNNFGQLANNNLENILIPTKILC